MQTVRQTPIYDIKVELTDADLVDSSLDPVSGLQQMRTVWTLGYRYACYDVVIS